MLAVLTSLYLLMNFSISLKLPSSFLKCNKTQRDFDECLRKAIEDAVKQMDKPIQELDWPSLEPLKIRTFPVAKGDGPVSFEQEYKNVNTYGLTKIKCKQAHMDFETNTLSMSMKFPEKRMELIYEVDNMLGDMPIMGKGPATVTLVEVNHTLIFKLEKYNKGKQDYYRAISSNLTMEPQFVTFNLTNLFNGDTEKSIKIHQQLNENWAPLYEDVKPSYEKNYAAKFLEIFNNLLAIVSVSELFP